MGKRGTTVIIAGAYVFALGSEVIKNPHNINLEMTGIITVSSSTNINLDSVVVVDRVTEAEYRKPVPEKPTVTARST